ncbi:MAG: Asp23/Gls24 family envelope stress response protein [Dietzia sp.]
MSNAVPQTGREKSKAEQDAERAAARRQDDSVEEFTPRGPLQTSRGVTTLDDTVVAKVAGMAAREVPGVYDMGSAARRAFSAVSDRIPNAQTNVSGGISIQKGETQAAVDVTVVVEYGASIVDVGNAIRCNVIEQVEGTTGLEVTEVNVNVVDVHLPDDDDASRGSASAPTPELR